MNTSIKQNRKARSRSKFPDHRAQFQQALSLEKIEFQKATSAQLAAVRKKLLKDRKKARTRTVFGILISLIIVVGILWALSSLVLHLFEQVK